MERYIKIRSLHVFLLLILFAFSMKSFACDPRKVGVFSRGYDNTSHAGSYWLNTLNISCQNNTYSATMTCQGETPIGKPNIVKMINYQKFKPYSYEAVVGIKIKNDKISISISNKAKNICNVSNIEGTYRYFSDSNEILPDDANFYNACGTFVKMHR